MNLYFQQTSFLNSYLLLLFHPQCLFSFLFNTVFSKLNFLLIWFSFFQSLSLSFYLPNSLSIPFIILLLTQFTFNPFHYPSTYPIHFQYPFAFPIPFPIPLNLISSDVSCRIFGTYFCRIPFLHSLSPITMRPLVQSPFYSPNSLSFFFIFLSNISL